MAKGINPLLSDFPDDDLNVGRRIVHANVTEEDEIEIKVQMKDGTVGQITIKASTIAQIILDRNNRKVEVDEVGQTISVDVGDGDLGGGNPGERNAVEYTDADELLAASKKRLPSGVVGGPVRRLP
jgi:hypothetical protein